MWCLVAECIITIKKNLERTLTTVAKGFDPDACT